MQAPPRKKPGKNPPEGQKSGGNPARGALILSKIFILWSILHPPRGGGGLCPPGGPPPNQNRERSDPPKPAPRATRHGRATGSGAPRPLRRAPAGGRGGREGGRPEGRGKGPPPRRSYHHGTTPRSGALSLSFILDTLPPLRGTPIFTEAPCQKWQRILPKGTSLFSTSDLPPFRKHPENGFPRNFYPVLQGHLRHLFAKRHRPFCQKVPENLPEVLPPSRVGRARGLSAPRGPVSWPSGVFTERLGKRGAVGRAL